MVTKKERMETLQALDDMAGKDCEYEIVVYEDTMNILWNCYRSIVGKDIADKSIGKLTYDDMLLTLVKVIENEQTK